MGGRRLRITFVTGAWPPDRCGVGDHTAGLAGPISGVTCQGSIAPRTPTGLVAVNEPPPRGAGSCLRAAGEDDGGHH